jgi:hypothetical protein
MRREASLRSSARSLDRPCHTDVRNTVPPRNSDTSSLPVCRRRRLVARSLDRQNTESRIDPKFVATNAQFQACYRASGDSERIVQIFYSRCTPSPTTSLAIDLIHDRFAICGNISHDAAVTMIADRCSDAIFIANKACGRLAIGDKQELDEATWRKTARHPI